MLAQQEIPTFWNSRWAKLYFTLQVSKTKNVRTGCYFQVLLVKWKHPLCVWTRIETLWDLNSFYKHIVLRGSFVMPFVSCQWLISVLDRTATAESLCCFLSVLSNQHIPKVLNRKQTTKKEQPWKGRWIFFFALRHCNHNCHPPSSYIAFRQSHNRWSF